VLDEHVVSTLPSASCRRYVTPTVPRNPAEMRVLALDAAAADLPETRREVDVVRGLFRRGSLLRGKHATREAFREKAPEADVIHLATHGLFRPDDSTFSSVLLSDGWISMHDIYGLRLRASLVCLSACQTGRSWIGAGDEIMGLSRGFLHAGAGALLVSLWSVDDAATADLMTSFYRSARAGVPMDEALARAMRNVREERPHPSHWAPFVLLGGSAQGLRGR
jgi:CHAT domain-containing protein